MHFKTAFCATSLLIAAVPSLAGSDRTYVQIIVKACPAVEQTGQDHKPKAVLGYYAHPINQGVIYDNSNAIYS